MNYDNPYHGIAYLYSHWIINFSEQGLIEGTFFFLTKELHWSFNKYSWSSKSVPSIILSTEEAKSESKHENSTRLEFIEG